MSSLSLLPPDIIERTLSVLEILAGVVERGFINALVVMSIYLTSRIMKFDDFTIEGSFGLGGAVTVAALLFGINPWIGLLLGGLCGAGAGLVTGFLHTKLGLNKLISGIVVTTMLFSISLNIGSANVALGNITTIFSAPLFSHQKTVLLGILAFAAAAFFWWLLKTELGLMLRSTGENEQFVTSLGKSVPFYITLSLILANLFTAFAGGVYVQYSGFYSIWGNVGTLISALAGCMIAELLAVNIFFTSILGAIIYQLIINATIELEIEPSWQKLITGLLIIFILLLKKISQQKKRLSSPPGAKEKTC